MLKDVESHRTQLNTVEHSCFADWLHAAFNFNSQSANRQMLKVSLCCFKKDPDRRSLLHTPAEGEKNTSSKHVMLRALIHFDTRKALHIALFYENEDLQSWLIVCDIESLPPSNRWNIQREVHGSTGNLHMS